MMVQTFPGDAEPLSRSLLKSAAVVVLHAMALAWLIGQPMRVAVSHDARPLDVRLIELQPPAVEKSGPLPPRIERKTAQPVTAPPPIMTAAADTAPAAAFAVAPQPPAPPREIPATVPVAPRAAPVPVAEAPPAPVPVTAARFDADYLNNPPPVYPAISRRLREEGRVLLQVRVTSVGAAEAVELRQGSGHVRLDEAALAAVKQWRFIPARRGVTPVAASVIVPIDFRIGP